MRRFDVLGLLILAAIIVWQIKRPKLCDRCKNLRAKTGLEYCCGGNPSTVCQCFRRAPSYCENFKPREENSDVAVS